MMNSSEIIDHQIVTIWKIEIDNSQEKMISQIIRRMRCNLIEKLKKAI